MYFSFVVFLLLLSGSQLVYRIWMTIRKGSYLSYSDPRFLVSLILSYYVIGDFIAAINHQWIDGVDHWPYVGSSLVVLLVFYNTICLGYRSGSKRINQIESNIRAASLPPLGIPKNLTSLTNLSLFLSLLGISLFLLGSGGNMIEYFAIVRFEDQFSAVNSDSRFDGALQNYLKYSLDLAAFGSVLLSVLLGRLKNPLKPFRSSSIFIFNRRSFSLGLLGLAISMSYLFIATTLGFRFRIAVLAIALFLSSVLANRRLPSKIFVTLSLTFLLLYASLVGIGRQYGSGLQADRLFEADRSNIFFGIFQESRVFHISGAAIAASDELNYRVGLAPVIGAITRPIPSQWLAGKLNYKYFHDLYYSIYKSESYMKTVASLVYAEMYIMFGFLSVIVLSFSLGVILARLRLWLLRNINDIGVIVIYSLLQGWLYILLTRTIPQSFQFLIFFVFLPYCAWRLAVPRRQNSNA